MISVIVVGRELTANDGVTTRRALYATTTAAKSMATRLTRDPMFATKWMSRPPRPVQLELPLHDPGI